MSSIRTGTVSRWGGLSGSELPAGLLSQTLRCTTCTCGVSYHRILLTSVGAFAGASSTSWHMRTTLRRIRICTVSRSGGLFYDGFSADQLSQRAHCTTGTCGCSQHCLCLVLSLPLDQSGPLQPASRQRCGLFDEREVGLVLRMPYRTADTCTTARHCAGLARVGHGSGPS